MNKCRNTEINKCKKYRNRLNKRLFMEIEVNLNVLFHYQNIFIFELVMYFCIYLCYDHFCAPKISSNTTT